MVDLFHRHEETMSVTIEFGDERKGQPVAQVATNKGWIDLADWLESLDGDAYPELAGLVQEGDCQDLDGLINDIDRPLDDDPPSDPSVAKTLEDLRSVVAKHKDEPYVIVSDGFASGYEDEESDETGEDEG
jgi:hypothetical protein